MRVGARVSVNVRVRISVGVGVRVGVRVRVRVRVRDQHDGHRVDAWVQRAATAQALAPAWCKPG